MKKIALAILILCLAASPVFALADTLRAEGTAMLAVVPDRAVLSVGFAAENSELSVSQRQVAAVVAALIEAAKEQGVEENNIATASLNIYPMYNYTESGSQLRGHRVEHMLDITVTDLDTVGDVLDAMLAAGANQASGITFASSQAQDVYLQALGLAVENAAAKAAALAIAAGVWLGGMEEINEITSGAFMYGQYAEAKYAAGANGSLGSTVMAGELNVTATVELVFEIR